MIIVVSLSRMCIWKTMGFSRAIAKTRVPATFAIVMVTLLFHACTPNENKLTAERGVADLHQKLDSALYHEIYASSDAEFKNAISESDAIAYFAAINNKLGGPKSAELKDWRVDFSANRTLVALFYETEFAQGRASEEFI